VGSLAYKEKGLSGSKLVLTKDKSNYQTVLDDFSTTNNLKVATYSLSYDLFNGLDPNCDIELVTGIPAINKIDEYIGILNRLHSTFTNVKTFINFDNHSKIIITDNKAYVGSANFSNGSRNNYECGIIIENDLGKVEEIFNDLTKDAIDYDTRFNQVTRVVIIKNIYSDLHDKITETINNLREYNKKEIGLHVDARKHHMDFQFFNVDAEFRENIDIINDLIEEFEELCENCDQDNDKELTEDIDWDTIYEVDKYIEDLDSTLDSLCEFDILKTYEHIYMKSVHGVPPEIEDEQKLSDVASQLAIEELKIVADNCVNSLDELVTFLETVILDNLKDIIDKADYYAENLKAYVPNKYKPLVDATKERIE
jgi:hypothetical protein